MLYYIFKHFIVNRQATKSCTLLTLLLYKYLKRMAGISNNQFELVFGGRIKIHRINLIFFHHVPYLDINDNR